MRRTWTSHLHFLDLHLHLVKSIFTTSGPFFNACVSYISSQWHIHNVLCYLQYLFLHILLVYPQRPVLSPLPAFTCTSSQGHIHNVLCYLQYLCLHILLVYPQRPILSSMPAFTRTSGQGHIHNVMSFLQCLRPHLHLVKGMFTTFIYFSNSCVCKKKTAGQERTHKVLTFFQHPNPNECRRNIPTTS